MRYPTESPVLPLNKDRIRVNLSAGGSKGPEHLGLLARLDAEKDITIVEVAGTSVGAIVAAFYTNGYTPEQIIPIFLEGIKNRNSPQTIIDCLPDGIRFLLGGWLNPGQFFNPDPATLKRYLSWFDPMSYMFGGMMDLRKSMQDMVARYNLKPNPQLTIYSCDILRKELVKFSGEDYDLAEALAASCALPGVFRPIWMFDKPGRPQLLVDGALYHYSAPDFNNEPSIFSVFEPSDEMPTKGTFFDLLLASREVYQIPLAGNHRHVDDHKHLVVTTKPKWPGLFSALDEVDVREMFDDGYAKMATALNAAHAEGRW